MAQNFRWLGVLYVVYAALVWVFLLSNLLFSLQGVGRPDQVNEWQAELQAVLIAPVPMLFVGFALIRGSDWPMRGAFALAIAEVALYALGKFYFGDISPLKLDDSDHFLWEISMSQAWFMPGAAIGALLFVPHDWARRTVNEAWCISPD
jgi:hypothetical protein